MFHVSNTLLKISQLPSFFGNSTWLTLSERVFKFQIDHIKSLTVSTLVTQILWQAFLDYFKLVDSPIDIFWSFVEINILSFFLSKSYSPCASRDSNFLYRTSQLYILPWLQPLLIMTFTAMQPTYKLLVLKICRSENLICNFTRSSFSSFRTCLSHHVTNLTGV